MKFALTQESGKLALVSQDGGDLSHEVDELNKVFERIEQEKTYCVHAESEAIRIAKDVETHPDTLSNAVKEVCKGSL